ncbi:MAG: DUF938 domain-containing protein [Rhodospirillaceae bacterium]|nr:DUF938 domain-containing protein [Rhodospirillales bacterium]
MKQYAPATNRNREPILAVLKQWLPPQGLVLEIASGTGEHAAFFAANLAGREWQPSDAEPSALASIAAWRDEAGLANLRPPVCLDVRDDMWPVDRVDAMFCANMIHISPWECTLGLMTGAGRVFGPGGVLVLYGPFKVGGKTAPSNLSFDADLKARNPAWGVRDLEAVGACAQAVGLDHVDAIPMPANNLCVVWRKRA